jgi:hypothetical protein
MPDHQKRFSALLISWDTEKVSQAKISSHWHEGVWPSPGTVGCLQRTIWEKKKPKRVIETPVYEYGQLADPR